jgi:elongation factor 3
MTELASVMELLSLGQSNVPALSARVAKEPNVLVPLFTKLRTEAALTGKGDEETKAITALNSLKDLANTAMLVCETYLLGSLSTMLTAAGHKQKTVRAAADDAVKAVCGKMSANSVREVLDTLFAASAVGQAWQSRVLALNMIASFGDYAPEQLGNSLPIVVPQLTVSMGDVKKEVKEAATAAMIAACDVIGNRDIEGMTPHIVRSISHPEEVPEIMHKLAGVTFVQSVNSSALAMVVPLLIRGLTSRVIATRRQSAVIIDNMSKLVDDAIDAAPFLPTLLPALAKSAESMSDPEARTVMERASVQLNKLSDSCEEAKKTTKTVEHSLVLAHLKSKSVLKPIPELVMSHLTYVVCSLMCLRKFGEADWQEVVDAMAVYVAKDAAVTLVDGSLKAECKDMLRPLIKIEEDDDAAEELCNCLFTLAYGTKILLHNTQMRLKRGHKYGLLGSNDSGKTTLMRAIANGSVEGFPDASLVRTVFVEADILGELSHLSNVDYIMADPRLSGLSKDRVLEVMATVGFTEDGKAKPNHAVSTLSGGWRMKLAMARAMLQNADILLLDEPTNHLDVINVAWVKNYINSLKNVTCVMVSHDSGFLNDCCTDILQINRLKLKQYRGNLNKFIEANPDARSYFSIKESKLSFTFPQPGPIEGIKSKSKALMKLSKCDFTYPGNTKPTLFDISIQVSMASRVGCVGENGAGKSTMIKVLTGEVVPQTGDVWRHPNARVAYVAQHAFHHIESHLDKTANEYIRWRYSNGEDKETLVKVSMTLTEEEAKLQKEPFEYLWKDEDGKTTKFKKIVQALTGQRRENKQKEYEYEVNWKNEGTDGWVTQKQLQRQGWDKAMKAADAKIAQRAGMYIRTLSSANVEKHLQDCGLDPEFATHYRMSALSGGQKVKVVLAACMWSQPHILILDEPTNYLDRESLGALAKAIEKFDGGVVIISHNNEFVKQLCPEEWVMDAGHLTTKGEVGWMDRQDDKISDQPVITTMTDALGNTSEVKVKKTLSKRDEKTAIKNIKKKIQAGEELDEDEEELAIQHNLY